LHSLSSKIGIIIIAYLAVSIFLCVKKSALLDVTIGMFFIVNLYKKKFTAEINGPLIKYFMAAVGFSAVIDISWMVIFFP
jgi:hypothetical protein